MTTQAPSPRTEIRRKAQRAHYDQATIRAIIDQALLCHIAFSDGQSVHNLPTACWRQGEHLYIHGANNSRLINTLLNSECAVCITHLDGLVLARSAFHHSMNYRSVVLYGQFAAVDTLEDKKNAMAAFIEHVSPGRNDFVRPADAAELAGTRILRLALDEAVAKVRNWGVEDSEADLAIPVWAGVLPLHTRAGQGQAEDGCNDFPIPCPPSFIAQESAP